MAPGESIRGQIHLELPKATPVHSIEVCLIGTVSALDGTRLGSMKTVTILEECKTVATASVTNARTNTTRRHTTPPASTTVSITPTVVSSTRDDGSPVGRPRRGSVNSQDRARSPTFSNQSNIIAAAAAATIAATGNTRRYSTEIMSRTFSMPSPYYAQGHNASSASLARPVSPTSTDVRGRRTSFSANVDMPLGGFGILGGRHNMSMINISSIGQYALDDPEQDDPSQPEAPSYDPPNYDHIVTTTSPRSSTDTDHSNMEPPPVNDTGATMTPEDSSSVSEPISATISSTIASVDDEDMAPARTFNTRSSSSGSSRSSITGENTPNSTTPATTTAASTAPVVEPKAVLMQPGNYVIPFSIRIPANTVMSLPGSFSDPVGNISYHIKAVMKQIMPSQDPYDPKALTVEPTFTSATQAIKLIPMNDPVNMPLYSLPYETESVRANVGHWVWSTGFMEAHAWVPKQGYRPGRMIPLVIHIVNHSDAKQVVVETTLCKCFHYGSGLTKVRAMGIAGHGYLMDPLFNNSTLEFDDTSSTAMATTSPPQPIERGRRRLGRSSSTRNGRSQQQQQQQQDTFPSPPASPPFGSNFSSTPSSDGGDSPEGSIHGARMTSPGSMASISSQWGSVHSSGSNENNSNSGVNGGSSQAVYNPNNRQLMMQSPTPSVSGPPQPPPLPIIQHQREKISKAKTMINCSLAVDREIQKTIMVPIPVTVGYSILNAPLLEVSYEIVVKIRAEKVYTRGLRLEVPIVVVVPEDNDVDDEEDLMLMAAANAAGGNGTTTDYSLAFSGDEYDIGYQGECPPYEATASSELVNPPDFIIDTASINFRSPELERSSRATVEVLATGYQLAKAAQGPMPPTADSTPIGGQVPHYAGLARATPILIRRSFTNTFRQKRRYFNRVGQPFLIAVMALIFFGRLNHSHNEVLGRLELFQQLMNITLASLMANIDIFPRERGVAFREISNGGYSATAFLLSYTANEFPLVVLAAAVCAAFVVLMAGLQATVVIVSCLWLVMLAYITTGESLGIVYSSCIHTVLKLPPVLLYLNHLSVFKYTSVVLALNEFTDLTFHCTEDMLEGTCAWKDGSQVLRFLCFRNKSLGLNIGLVWVVLVARMRAHYRR
ncbi:ATP-binding cassette sub- G member 5 [Podila minutissima]|nr:ATP-binding cassette sub- G member 5 [Podila minutissima]